MRKKIALICLVTILLSSCQSVDNQTYIDYLRQFNETIQSIEIRNKIICNEFNILNTERPIKIKPYYEQLKLVDKQKEKLFHFLDSLISCTDTVQLNKVLNFQKINSDDLNLAIELKKADIERINAYLLDYKKVIVPTSSSKERIRFVKNSIDTILSSEKMEKFNRSIQNKLKTIEFWTYICQLKADIEITELLILSYLYSQIDTGCCFCFRKIEAFVVPNSQILPVGIPYKADIFLAVIDTTISSLFEIEGKEYKAQSCKGFYSFKVAEKPGKYEKPGNFLMKSPYTSEIQKIPFKIEYEVLEKK